MTTMQVSDETKQTVTELKNHPTETYEKALVRILSFYREALDEDLSDDDLAQMKTSIENLQSGKFKSLSEIRKKYPKRK